MQNNPNKRGGQQGPRGRKLYGRNYPLTDREQELQGEINSPTIPAVYYRTQTTEQSEGSEDGRTGESSHNLSKAPETWDSVAPMTEENMHAKFVKLGIEPEDESIQE